MLRRRDAARTAAYVLAIAVLPILVQVVSAASPVGAEIQIQATARRSHEPRVAYNFLHEEFLVVWWDSVDGLSWDVWGCRVELDGTTNSPFVIATAPGKRYYSPDVSYNSARDEYLVVYVYEYAAGDTDLRGRTVSWEGGTIGSELLVVTEFDRQEEPAIAYNPIHDEYLVVYTNYWAEGLEDIAAQRVNGDLTLLSWANVATSPVTKRRVPSVVFDLAHAQYLITYSYKSVPTRDGWTALGKIAVANLAGVSVAPEIEICTLATCGGTANASSGGGFLVTWFDHMFSPRARRFAADGTPLGADGGFAFSEDQGISAAIPDRFFSPTFAPPIGYVVVWQETDSTSGYPSIRLRLLKPDSDDTLGDQFTVAGDIAYQEHPWVACAPWGVCLVSYMKDDDIFARLLHLFLFGDDFESGDFAAWSSWHP